MANEKIIQICDWETVEQKTRTGTMADLVIDSILKRMWTEKKGLLQGVFLAFGGGSMVFDSPMPGVLRLNTYCRDEDSESGFGGEEHVRPVFQKEQLEDSVWTLLAQAFDDLCNEDQFCSEDELKAALSSGTHDSFLIPAFAKYPKDSVFLRVWFGERVSANWLGENIILIQSETEYDGPIAECLTTDPVEKRAAAAAQIIREEYATDIISK